MITHGEVDSKVSDSGIDLCPVPAVLHAEFLEGFGHRPADDVSDVGLADGWDGDPAVSQADRAK
jgi:hypothetical protein